MQCARAYPTESQIGNAITDLGTWYALIQAGFPAYEAEADEAPADHRTEAERDHALARQMLLNVGRQGSLFPLEEFEPTQVTLRRWTVLAEPHRAEAKQSRGWAYRVSCRCESQNA